MLDEDHAEAYEGALADGVDTVFCHWVQDLDGILKASPSACNAHNPRDLFGVLEEQES